MLAWYGCSGKERILAAPGNFCYYNCGRESVYTIDPRFITDFMDPSFQVAYSGKGPENERWKVEKVEIPDEDIKELHDLCFRNASERRVFGRLRRIFRQVVLDLKNESRLEKRVDPPIEN